MKKKGFTLVELSIVLVIIGLLIGGILAAQSMISAGKLVSFVSQMQQYDAVVTNFQTKYNYLPGDAPTFTPAGNGDGMIFNSTNSGDDQFTYVIANVWKHISNAGMLQQAYTNTDNKGQPGVDVPQAKYGPEKNIGIYLISYDDDLGDFTAADHGQAIFYICYTGPDTSLGVCGVSNYTAQNKTFLPSEALAFDKKVDDGLPASGNVRAGRDDRVQYTSTSDCDNGWAYNLNNTSIRACALAIKYGFSNSAQ